MPISSSALANEINTDPLSMGYAPLKTAGNSAGLAALLNATTGPGAASIFKRTVPATDVQSALDAVEFDSLTSLQLSKLSVMLAGAVVNSGAASVRQIIIGIFTPSGSFTNTRAALTALASRTGSRAEVLFGADTTVTSLDVSLAMGRN